MSANPGRAKWVAVCGVAAALMFSGCSSDDGSTSQPDPSASVAASATPSASPSASPKPTASATATPRPTATATPAPTPAATTAAPPPAFTQAPQLPPEQSVAAEGFAACAQRYQERTQNVTLGGAVTPVLLEEWAQAYEAASAKAAEGDPAGAAKACQDLQSAMDAVLR